MRRWMMDGPIPLFEIALEAASDDARLVAPLARHAHCTVLHARPNGPVIVAGGSEAGLNALATDLRASCDVRVGAPRIAYRETVLRRVEIDRTEVGRPFRDTGFARVRLVVRPGDVPFTSEVAESVVPVAAVAAVKAGVAEVLAAGVLLGARTMGVAATLVDGTWREGSTIEAFHSAGRAACREALSSGVSALLEPVMAIELAARADDEEAIVRDLRSRRGRVGRRRRREGEIVVDAEVPLVNLLGYGTDLLTLTENTGRFSSIFHAYEPVPPPEPPGFPGAVALPRGGHSRNEDR